jgi:serine/threonine protein kinase
MAGPASLKDWVKSRPTGGIPLTATLPEGLRIGSRYRIRRLLGIGGMGAVYRARDEELDRDVALKLIRSEIADNPAALERFKREVQLSSRVTHKNVLRVYDLAESDGVKFLSMQFVDGVDLSTVLKRDGRLPVARFVRLWRQILEGLRAAHEQGVVHRDLKPQNVMVDATDRVYVTDFGLAKSLEQSGVTQTGAIVGTPYYMSPEQVKGAPVDHRSDIYSAGVLLYEMATGRLPFTGATPYEVMAQRLQKAPTRPRRSTRSFPPSSEKSSSAAWRWTRPCATHRRRSPEGSRERLLPDDSALRSRAPSLDPAGAGRHGSAGARRGRAPVARAPRGPRGASRRAGRAGSAGARRRSVPEPDR